MGLFLPALFAGYPELHQPALDYAVLPELLDLLRRVSQLGEDCVCILAQVWNLIHPRLYTVQANGRQQGLQRARRRCDIARAASPRMLRVRQEILY